MICKGDGKKMFKMHFFNSFSKGSNTRLQHIEVYLACGRMNLIPCCAVCVFSPLQKSKCPILLAILPKNDNPFPHSPLCESRKRLALWTTKRDNGFETKRKLTRNKGWSENAWNKRGTLTIFLRNAVARRRPYQLTLRKMTVTRHLYQFPEADRINTRGILDYSCQLHGNRALTWANKSGLSRGTANAPPSSS